ncbi:MAG: BREX-3 system phosphatase PglZ [Anaerolineae bacterium]|nr:BREX-3 system phosphatase PglZ [Anaerolineae bacterium]
MGALADAILASFPARAHPLVVVSDPDGLLGDEAVLAGLVARGYRLVREADPVRLRYRVEQERPFSAERPLLVVTEGELRELPYDLWQQGQRVRLSLHELFPDLYYPLVRELSPRQRDAAYRAPEPPKRLGERATAEYLLRHVFGAELARLAEPGALIRWLNDYHRTPDPMPAALAGVLLSHLRRHEVLAGWPLEAMLAGREAFSRFVQEQWGAYLSRMAGGTACESTAAAYLVPFGEDESLQDAVSSLVRTGALAPVPVGDGVRLPAWARAGVEVGDEAYARERAGELVEEAEAALERARAEARWEAWQGVARLWAELHNLLSPRIGPDWEPILARRARLAAALDAAFAAWLREHYAPLGVRQLPRPHHVYHVPEYLAYERRRTRRARVALLVMDGLSLADWLLIGAAWRARHAGWRFSEQMLLAQVPTVTSVSRQALIGGLRPAELPSLTDGREEPRLWSAFWAREELPAVYARLRLDRGKPPPDLEAPGPRALCLVDDSIDELLHGASLGAHEAVASLQVWLAEYSPRLEALIDDLLACGYSVYVASDHGHVQARGMGRPSEGVVVDARGQRARIFSDRHAAARVQMAFPQTVLWSGDGLLPDGVYALMPEARLAFAPAGDVVVSHGGITPDEMIVPLVDICTGE